MNKHDINMLWESVYKLCYLMADKYYILHAEICERSGITKEDLRQESYIAFLKAVEAYEADGQYKFSAYLNYPLQNAFNALCGMRTQRDRQEPLNSCDSLDREIMDDNNKITLGDTVEDKENHIENAEERIYINQLHDTLETAMTEKCTSWERNILTSMYYKGKTLKETGAKPSEKETAMRKLRRYLPLREYRKDIISRSYTRGGFSLFRDTGESSTEWAALKLLNGG